MMETVIDRELLEKIADLTGKPVGAFNIRKDSGWLISPCSLSDSAFTALFWMGFAEEAFKAVSVTVRFAPASIPDSFSFSSSV